MNCDRFLCIGNDEQCLHAFRFVINQFLYFHAFECEYFQQFFSFVFTFIVTARVFCRRFWYKNHSNVSKHTKWFENKNCFWFFCVYFLKSTLHYVNENEKFLYHDLLKWCDGSERLKKIVCLMMKTCSNIFL